MLMLIKLVVSFWQTWFILVASYWWAVYIHCNEIDITNRLLYFFRGGLLWEQFVQK